MPVASSPGSPPAILLGWGRSGTRQWRRPNWARGAQN